MHRGSLGEGEAERIARNLARMYELGNWSWGESGRNTLANYLEAYLGVQGGKGSFWDSVPTRAP